MPIGHGQSFISGVEFKHCGQTTSRNSRSYTVLYLAAKSQSYLKKSSLHHNYNTAVGLISSSYVLIEDNVIHNTQQRGTTAVFLITFFSCWSFFKGDNRVHSEDSWSMQLSKCVLVILLYCIICFSDLCDRFSQYTC